MGNNSFANRELAKAFVKNNEKDNVIAAIFDYFSLDCIERCNINPAQFDNLVNEFNKSEKSDEAIVESIIDLIKSGRKTSVDKENELIKEIVAAINKNLIDDVSIEDIAKELNISYYYMCHIFKNKYGMSINTFKTQKKLETAIQKLLQSDEKIADIAISCGFNNVSYFTEIFTKNVGVSPTAFRTENQGVYCHEFYKYIDMMLATKMKPLSFISDDLIDEKIKVEKVLVHSPDEVFSFLHEAAIIEYHGVLFASWYNCPKNELMGYTPICEKRSYDGGKTWSELKIICADKSEKILYCPPVYGIFDDKLYMFVNQMVAPDHIHSLDLYVLNNDTNEYELLWSRPIPFKLNTNVVALPNGKLMLPGRVGELDSFPVTPAVMISDSGKMDDTWRLVKVAENGALPDGSSLVHPETTVFLDGDTLYMFNRNDQRGVPIVYTSTDFGESWSEAYSHDIPYISSKIYVGNLSSGKKYLIANIDDYNRSKLAIYFTDVNSNKFSKKIMLFDKQIDLMKEATMCHYPCAYESNGKLYVIATIGRQRRGAILFIINLNEI